MNHTERLCTLRRKTLRHTPDKPLAKTKYVWHSNLGPLQLLTSTDPIEFRKIT